MANTYRSIDTRFWSDGWVRKLNSLDRYLFLYLLTNTHVNWCGIYELDLAMMAFESGIDKEDLQKSMLPRLEPKVIYEDGWVFVKNFANYHSGGLNAEKGRKAAIDSLPQRIRAKISSILGKEEVKSNPLEGDTPLTSASAFTSASTLASKPPKKAKSDEYSLVIDLFKEINPSYRIYFNRKPQQDAATRLFKTHGIEQLRNVIGYIKAYRGERYLPTIQSPYDLEEKWAKLESFAKKEHKQQNDFII